MLENLVLFTALVLVAVAAGKTNDMTFWRADLLLGAPCLRRDLHRGNHLGAHRAWAVSIAGSSSSSRSS